MRSSKLSRMACVALVLCLATSAVSTAKEWVSGIVWPEPVVVNPGTAEVPPSDAIVLFDGNSLQAWENGENWEIQDGVATAKKSGLTTKQAFGDCQLHLEFATPAEVSGSGQGRGNSGVYLMGRYEVQILDSYENKTYFDGQCASLYKTQPPLVNACRKPGEWQSYDIIFARPHFDAQGHLIKPATVTVLQNGVLVQNHAQLLGETAWDRPPTYKAHPDRLPISLQFHGNPVKFRNIWLREIQPLVPQYPETAKPAA